MARLIVLILVCFFSNLQAMQQVESVMRDFVDNKRLPNVQVAVQKDGRLLYFSSYGMADLEEGSPIRDDSIYRIYSMTKPITSVAAMILVEEGKLSLEDSVKETLPDFEDLWVWGSWLPHPADRDITIHDLITHQSGLTYGFFGLSPADIAYLVTQPLDADEGRTVSDMVDDVTSLPLYSEPGSVFRYGVSTDVLGAVVEQVSGQSLQEFFKERIFEPLGMKDTSFILNEEQQERLVRMYRWDEDAEELALAEQDLLGARFAPGRTFLSGGGGLAGTTADYMRFAQMILNKGSLDGVRILKPETVELMGSKQLHNPVPENSLLHALLPGWNFGLGFAVLEHPDVYPHQASKGALSWGGIANTRFLIDPENQLVIIHMSQCFAPCAREVQAALSDAVYEELDLVPAD